MKLKISSSEALRTCSATAASVLQIGLGTACALQPGEQRPQARSHPVQLGALRRARQRPFEPLQLDLEGSARGHAIPCQPLQQVLGQDGHRGVVEDEGRRESQPRGASRRLRNSTASSESNPSSLKGRPASTAAGSGCAEHTRDLGAEQVEHRLRAVLCGRAGQALPQLLHRGLPAAPAARIQRRPNRGQVFDQRTRRAETNTGA